MHRHLENEGRLDDDEHRAEVAESSEKTFRSQLLLDAIVEAEGVKVGQDELTSYLIQAAGQYGMEPGEEITVNYGETHHEGRLACRCGAPNCVGRL